MHFKYLEVLWLIVLLIPLFFVVKGAKNSLETLFTKETQRVVFEKQRGLFFSKKIRSYLLLLSMIFVIVALARPYEDRGEIKVKSSFVNVIAAIDISKSMFCDDLYPNRFEFAKRKFFDALDYLKDTQVALLGFGDRTFLISPLTKDINSLRFLAKNLRPELLSLKGTNIMELLRSANKLFGDEKNKSLLIFTDGGDKKRFDEEIAYAKEHHIRVYVYLTATDKGGVIKDENGVIKDKEGNIVIVRANHAIKELALKTGGAYMRYSLSRGDIKGLIEQIKKDFGTKKSEETTIKDTKELFYYPLGAAIVLYFMSLFSLPRRRTA